MPDPADRSDDPIPRNLPGWTRLGSVLVRTVHLISCAAILGAQLVVGNAPNPGAWWAAAAVSGVLLAVYEMLTHRALWRLLAGWATILKLALLALARLVPSTALAALLAAFAIAVLGAHLPRRWRHRRLF